MADNELRCSAVLISFTMGWYGWGWHKGSTLRLEVEQPFPTGRYFRNARLYVIDEITQEENSHFYNLTPRFSPNFGRYEYLGAGLDLEINVWPDRRPRWGSSYSGILMSSAVNDWERVDLNCRFPNAI